MKSRWLSGMVLVLGVLLISGACWGISHNAPAGERQMAAGTGAAKAVHSRSPGTPGKAIPGNVGLPARPNPARAVPAPDFGRLPLYFIENRGQVDQEVKYYARGHGHTTFFTRKGLVLTLAQRDQDTPKAGGQGHYRRGEFRDRLRRGPRGTSPPPARTLTSLSRLGDFFAPFGHWGAACGALKGGLNLWPATVPASRAGERAERAAAPRPGHYAVVRLTPVGLTKKVKVKALDLQQCRVNYFIGKDPKKWRTNIPTYAGVLYQDAYAGIDLKFYGHGRMLEYDVVVRPGADPGQVRFAYEGVKELRLTAGGDLALVLPDGGELLQRKPYVYQEIAGQRVPREARFRVAQGQARLICGFQVAAYDPARPLIIDPVLAYSTYLGGSRSDEPRAIAVDAAGAAYVCGTTWSTDFPTHQAVQETKGGNNDAFVTKLVPGGNSLVYSTYLGGEFYEYAMGIAVDAAGAAYVGGSTGSSDFPTYQAWQETYAGSEDAFVTKLAPGGDALAYSTYLGGSDADAAWGLALDATGAAYVSGYTWSTDFPTYLAWQETYAGDCDVFVTKLVPGGSGLAYSTYLGGSGSDYARGIALDADGAAYVCGYTWSTNFPTYLAWQGTFGGGDTDAFVTKLVPGGSALAYSTYLGGGNTEEAYDIAVDASGAAYVCGYTQSTNFPTYLAWQGTYAGGMDAFVTKFAPGGGSLAYSTYLGGSSEERAFDIAVDATGAAFVSGYTFSTNFPTYLAYQGTLAGTTDAFVTKFAPGGGSLAYSTYLGGSVGEAAYVALDAEGAAYVSGYTTSTNFPTYLPWQGTYAGFTDTFVAKLINAYPQIQINASAGPNGNISPAGQVFVTYGGNKTFTITPNPGYRVDSVLVDSVSVGSVRSYTFTQVVTAHTIEANFKKGGSRPLMLLLLSD